MLDLHCLQTCMDNDISINPIKIISPFLYEIYSDTMNDLKEVSKSSNKFIKSCSEGYLKVARWLYFLKRIDIHFNNDEAFLESCKFGHLHVAQWLYSLGEDTHFNNDQAFLLSCKFGHLHVAQWLYSLEGVNIHFNNDEAFLESSVDMYKWLCSINKHSTNISIKKMLTCALISCVIGVIIYIYD